MKEKNSFVFKIRQAVGETQPVFAERLGVGLRSLKEWELEGRMPRSKAVLRTLDKLAQRHGVTLQDTITQEK